ncbi:hypothetical protein B0H17DRAFT_1131905 [Mycena rosella]|uniref:Uncharacterized protein n=1 Tax=Mycena rosella TaxID=1033263 RepID=A0AAD7DLJ0_MYCRO|nr:hypothetical protein B0H17DRAFT_1131905 [Mycena rosella]
MTDPLPCRGKHKKSGKNLSGPAKRSRPRLGDDGYSATDEERAAKHRQASREYYERNVHIREKNRQHAAEVRAQKKARRRQWDPPKVSKSLKAAVVPQDSPCLPSQAAEHYGLAEDDAISSCPPEADPRGQTHDIVELLGPALLEDDEQRVVQKYKAARKSEGGADCGSIGSPTSAEHIAMQALTELAKPTVSVNPAPETPLQIILGRASSERAAPMTATQVLDFVVGTRVRDANAQVAALNTGRLTKPSRFDRQFWIRSSPTQDTEYLTDVDRWTVLEWSRRVWAHGHDGEFMWHVLAAPATN